MPIPKYNGLMDIALEIKTEAYPGLINRQLGWSHRQDTSSHSFKRLTSKCSALFIFVTGCSGLLVKSSSSSVNTSISSSSKLITSDFPDWRKLRNGWYGLLIWLKFINQHCKRASVVGPRARDSCAGRSASVNFEPDLLRDILKKVKNNLEFEYGCDTMKKKMW